MKTALSTWDLPTTRESGNPLPVDEILHVEVSVSADLGATYTVLDSVIPPDTELTVPDLEAGEWRFRLVVVDINNRRSADVDVSVVVPDETAPGVVTNVQISLS